MEPKKNPKADVGRNSALYFSIGLLLMMLLVYYAINYKTYEKKVFEIGQLSLDEELEEDVPITEQLQTPPPPPPPPAAPEVIEVVENEKEIEETIIESTETDQEEEIAEVEDIADVAEVEEDIDVPFAVIENVPVFPGCEKGTNEEKKKCLNDKMNKFVSKKFNTDLASELGLSGVQKIYVMFKIDKNGDIVDIQSRAPHPRLQKEAERVIGLLPKMKPGMQRGKPVRVPYSLPIIFKVQ